MTTSAEFFISYSTKDIDFVEKLHQDLQANGLSVWRDKTDIRGTDPWTTAIQNALLSAKYMILVLSKDSMASEQVEREWMFFRLRSKPILCVWLNDCEVHFQIYTLQRADFRNPWNYQEAFERFLKECRLLVESGVQPEEMTSDASKGTDSPTLKASWPAVAALASDYTHATLGERYRDRYSNDYYLHRPHIFEHFTNFLSSEKKLMVLTGDAGAGKSSFMCSMIRSVPATEIVFLHDCATRQIEDTESIDAYLSRVFKFAEPASMVFQALHEADPTRRILLLFDSVNENPDKENLLRKISTFVVGLHTCGVKVLITARTPIWDGFKGHLTVHTDDIYQTAGPNSFVKLQPFTSDELPQVYRLYQAKYNLKTRFEQLSPQSRNFFAQPLFLKLTAEVYENQHLPTTLVMEDVFEYYVKRCLGPKGTNGVEYSVLEQAVILMYEKALRELQVALLDLKSAEERIESYRNLVDRGLFSERREREAFHREIELVSITYERVFEFLLGQLAVPTISRDTVITHLALARDLPFTQLRGALELMMCFDIVRRKNFDLVVQLAHEDAADYRQFLVDVIKAVYDTGDRDLAKRITLRLSEDEQPKAKLVAVQAAYTLRLDDLLTDLALTDDEDSVLRDTASIYLYQRWNRARLDGNIEDGYDILRSLVASIKWHNPRRARRALTAVLYLSANLLSHLIDDPKSLIPLADIYKSLIRKIPGLENRTSRNAVFRFAIEKGLTFVANSFANMVSRALELSALGDENSMEKFFADPQNGRALMDSSMFWDVDDLLGEKDKLKRLMTWKHDVPAIQIRGPILYHLYHTPEKHFDFVEELFEEMLATGHITGTANLVAAICYAMACRVLRNEPVLPDHINRLEEIISSLWFYIDEANENRDVAEIANTLIGYFVIEAMQQKREGKTTGSRFIKRLVGEIGHEINETHFNAIFVALERFAYSGYPDFVLSTILEPRVRLAWETHGRDGALKMLCKLRSFYQDVVDTMLLEDKTPENDRLWNDVRAQNAMPNIADMFSLSLNLTMVATSIVPNLTKVGGIVIIDLATSKSMKEFFDRLLRTALSSLFDYATVDIGFTEWFRAHKPGWDNFEKYNIPRMDPLPPEYNDVKLYSVARIREYIKTAGKGIYFDEL